MIKYPVNEVFATIQGEARFTGTPSLFVRLQGCDVGCPWCDTKHTWDLKNESELEPDLIIAKQEDSPNYAYMTVDEILNLAMASGVSHVVITGGEPATYDLSYITSGLINAGFTVQIETSGTYEIICHNDAWVTISPKENMPGGRVVLKSSITRANEVKYPVGKQKDVECAKKYQRQGVDVWLQPLSQSKKATLVCVNACLEHGFKLSIQSHKFIGLR